MSTKATAWVIFVAFYVYFLCAVINLSHGNWASSGNIEVGNWASPGNIEVGNWASSGKIVSHSDWASSGNIEAGLFKVCIAMLHCKCIAGVCFETGKTVDG